MDPPAFGAQSRFLIALTITYDVTTAARTPCFQVFGLNVRPFICRQIPCSGESWASPKLMSRCIRPTVTLPIMVRNPWIVSLTVQIVLNHASCQFPLERQLGLRW